MSAAFDREIPATRCGECLQECDDLTPLGRRDLCPRCFRESIADMELLPSPQPMNVDPWMENGE